MIMPLIENINVVSDKGLVLKQNKNYKEDYRVIKV